MPKLVLLLPDGSWRDVALRKDRITLGRRPDNDVCLPHPAVSGEHAAVVTILSDSFLEDLGSTNGTFVNGEPVQKHFLRDGDVIELGRQRLVFLVDENAHPAGAPPPPPAAVAARAGAGADPAHWDKPSTIPGVTPTALPATASTRTPAAPAHAPAPERTPVASAPSHGGDAVDPHAAPSGHPDAAGVVDAHRAGGGPAGVADAPRADAHVAGPAEAHTSVPSPTDAPCGAGATLPELLVLTGPSAGRTLALTKEVTSIGRVGVQIALVRRTERGFCVHAGEGSPAPVLNGSPVASDGALLEPGDIIDVAGARIEFLAATDLPL